MSNEAFCLFVCFLFTFQRRVCKWPYILIHTELCLFVVVLLHIQQQPSENCEISVTAAVPAQFAQLGTECVCATNNSVTLQREAKKHSELI